MDLIDRNAFAKRVLPLCTHPESLKKMLDEEPTVDAEPVRHGRWIPIEIPTGVSAFGIDEMTAEDEKCSICGEQYWVGQDKKYCPNCGAKMNLEDEHGNS